MKKNLIMTGLAFIATSVFAAVAGPLVGLLTGEGNIQDFMIVSLVFWFYALGVTVIAGLPLYLVFNYLNWMRWWSSVLVGFVCGAVVRDLFRLPPMYIVIGGLSGLVFWIVWRYGEIDRKLDR
jgi:hypothetical protein